MSSQQKIAIIGGGAAGFFAAIAAKQHWPTAEVCILEKSNKFLAKVKISGAGVAMSPTIVLISTNFPKPIREVARNCAKLFISSMQQIPSLGSRRVVFRSRPIPTAVYFL